MRTSQYLFSTLLVFFLLSAGILSAQNSKDLKATFETVQETCEDRPLAERVTVVVTRFNVTTRSYTPELGENMATILTNALQQVNCFRVLENWDNADDFLQEIDVNPDYVEQGTAPEKGKLKGAQLVVTGEVTEFTIQDKSFNALGVRTKKEIVKLGFILKVINPQTRDILWSESINVEGKASGGGSLGIGVPLLGRINFVGAANDNPAVANALEQGAIYGTEELVNVLDQLELPELPDPNSVLTVITVTNADYMSLRGLESAVSGLAGVSSVSKTFSDGTGTLSVRHTGSTEELLDLMYGNIQSEYEIFEVAGGKIGLARQ